MANPESARLAVDVIARIDKFEREMKRAQRVANDNFSGVERRGKQMADRLEREMGGAASRIVGTFKTFGAGVLAGMSVEAVTRGIGQIVKGVAEIGDEARRAGVSARAFQELRFVSEQNRISVDSMVDGLKELNLRADEWIVTGSGPAAEAFQRLGYSASELKEKLKDPSALFSEIIGKLGKLDKAAQIRIADEVFGGTGGEKFVQLIEQGEQGIRAQIKAANDLGLVMDEAMIKRADELDRKFNALKNFIGTELQAAILMAADALGVFVEEFGALEKRRTELLAVNSKENDAERLRLENEILDLKRQQAEITGTFAQHERRLLEITIGEKQRQLAELTKRSAEIESIIASRTPTVMTVGRRYDPLSSINTNSPTVSLPGSAPTPDRRIDPYFDDASAAAGRAASSFDGLSDAVSRFVDNVVRAESGGDRSAKNPNSSATGLGQFIESTWLDMFQKAFPDRAASMSRETILALRNDAEISRTLIEQYARENASLLRQAGVSVNEAALQLSHFLGPQGAISVLKAAPSTPVSQLLSPEAISANPTILGYGATAADVIAYAERRTQALRGEKQAVDELSDSWEGLRQTTADTNAIKAQQAAYQQLEQIGVGALQSLAGALQDGKLEGRELLGILAQVVQQLLSMPSGGGLGGFLSFLPKLFGFADGGIARNGRPISGGKPLKRYARGGVAKEASIFGEAGTEAAVPLPDGRSIPVTFTGPKIPQKGGGSSDVVRVVLQDDSGRMAEIADQQIRTRSGTIVQVAVSQSTKAVRKNMSSYIGEAQMRSM